MRANRAVLRRVLLAAAITSASARAVTAQLPNASPAAYGMAGNYTAIARGYEAVAWNPANLAMPGRPFLSFGLMSVGGTVGMDPVGFGMLHNYSGLVVDSAVRASWVDLVKTAARQRIRIDGGITPIAFSVGPIGFQTGVALYTNMDLSPGMFEGVMFGNAGQNNGQAKPLDFTGTGAEMAVFGTGAVSFALPLPVHFTGGLLGPEHLAIGISGKYIGGTMAIANAGTTVFGTNSVDYTFPVLAPSKLFAKGDTGQVLGGVGAGADISAAWSAGRWKVGAMVENVFNTFKWDTTHFALKSSSGHFDADTNYSTDTTLTYGQGPQALRDKVAAQKFSPAINVGVAFKPTDFLTVTADVHQQLGDANAISIGPKNRMGVGVELRILPFVPIRAGLASVTDGWQAGAGFGLHLLGYELGVSGNVRKRGAATESGIMLNVLGIGH